ncbi:MAG: hypothetical protein PHF21_02640 [Bacilli bacterium]|nr:hypothetical protein [Bacilli bacterium]
MSIAGNTEITADMVGSIAVSKSMVETTSSLITSHIEVVGKYVKYDTTIPEGSLFYRPQLMTSEELPNSIIKDIPENYTVYSLKVDMHSTYGNSIMPNDFIDLYFKAVDDNNYIIFGKFIESIKVLAVKDSTGHHVFSSSSNHVPAELLFAVKDEYFLLLRKAGYIRTNSIEIVPVPRNKNYTDKPGDTQITSEEIRAFINAKAIDARQNEGTDVTITD